MALYIMAQALIYLLFAETRSWEALHSVLALSMYRHHHCSCSQELFSFLEGRLHFDCIKRKRWQRQYLFVFFSSFLCINPCEYVCRDLKQMSGIILDDSSTLFKRQGLSMKPRACPEDPVSTF